MGKRATNDNEDNEDVRLDRAAETIEDQTETLLDIVDILLAGSKHLSSAARFMALSQSTDASLEYLKRQLFETFGVGGATVWSATSSGNWTLAAASGDTILLPARFRSWSDWNEHVVSLAEVTFEVLPGPTAGAFLVASGAAGFDGMVVLNLVTKSTLKRRDVFANFVETAACMLATQWFHNQTTSHRSLSRTSRLGERLSERQQQIVELMLTDLTYSQIANRLGFSESTVRQEAMSIFDKLGVANRSGVRQHRQSFEAD